MSALDYCQHHSRPMLWKNGTGYECLMCKLEESSFIEQAEKRGAERMLRAWSITHKYDGIWEEYEKLRSEEK